MARSMVTMAAAAAAMLWLAALPAQAAPRITEKTTYYSITGKTGMELFWDMNRRGPKHGFLTKAIAQTQFKPDIKGEFVHSGGVCRMRNGQFTLNITYVYPQPKTKLTGVLAKRWAAFQATNVAHEREHGRIAKRMAADVDALVRKFSWADGPSCRKADAQFARELTKAFKSYNKTQADFDKKEHRDNGPVEKSILALVKK